MTEEELQVIEERYRAVSLGPDEGEGDEFYMRVAQSADDVPILLAEIRAMKAGAR